jgi:hypothetical protein
MATAPLHEKSADPDRFHGSAIWPRPKEAALPLSPRSNELSPSATPLPLQSITKNQIQLTSSAAPLPLTQSTVTTFQIQLTSREAPLPSQSVTTLGTIEGIMLDVVGH